MVIWFVKDTSALQRVTKCVLHFKHLFHCQLVRARPATETRADTWRSRILPDSLSQATEQRLGAFSTTTDVFFSKKEFCFSIKKTTVRRKAQKSGSTVWISDIHEALRLFDLSDTKCLHTWQNEDKWLPFFSGSCTFGLTWSQIVNNGPIQRLLSAWYPPEEYNMLVLWLASEFDWQEKK